MDTLKPQETVVKRRRLTMAELAEILDSVAEKSRSETEHPLVPIAQQRAPKRIYQEMPRKNLSKAAALGVPEKILSLVAMNPDWGTQRLAKSLSDQGISLSRQSIHKLLVTYNLNRPAMRKAWQATQKETNP